MFEQKCNLIEATEKLKAGMFVHIHGYINSHGEKQNATFHADANYENTHKRSAEMLDKIEQDESLSFEIVRNAWIDAKGIEYKNKAKDRTKKLGIKETITIHDKDFPEAVAKLRKSIIDPRKQTDNFEKVGKSTYDNSNTNKTYFRNVLVASKVVVVKGIYEPVCSARVNAIKDALKDMLPIGEYRQYVLDDEMVKVADGTEAPRFEYVALMGESVSSSSSSDDA